MNKITIQPGNELRGMKIRLYPTPEDVRLLTILEDDTRYGWNWLVSQTEQVIQARQAYAVRSGLVGPRPERPNYDGLLPEESKAAKKEYTAICRAWHGLVHAATNKLEACSYRKFPDLLTHYGFIYDYQLLARVISWRYDEGVEREIVPSTRTLQALVKNYFTTGSNQRRKKFRKQSDSMPLQSKSGVCFELGNFGKRRNKDFYDCQLRFNGLKIKGRTPGKLPEGRIIGGVSITREADGWWASIKQEVPIRTLAEPTTKSIGIDVGLDNIVALSDGRIVENPREIHFAAKLADLQHRNQPTGRHHQKMKKNTEHLIYNAIIHPLMTYELVGIEALSSKIGQMGSRKMSVMRRVAELLKQRLGDRVREVPCHYTSQDCSQCKHRSKESWAYDNGPIGHCPACGYSEHRDINAARNVEYKMLESLAA